MTTAETLLPLMVLAPLGVAALLGLLAHWLPPRLADGAAVLTALGLALLGGWLAHQATGGAIAHWFGGWTVAAPQGRPVVLGIGFLADPASAAMAAFCCFLFLMSFVFAWGYFDEIHSHFHILMLLFLGAMNGFCLTHDLFDLFVWFELMSVAAFALTAYPLGSSALEGAFNFTITNALAGFMMLLGTGLLYARAGALDYAALGQAMTHQGGDPVAVAGFCLIAAALLTKAAILPFHLWLADAHAVAPSPVSVIFSGVMVSLGLFGLMKLGGQLFAGLPGAMATYHHLLLWLGAATALVAGLTAWAQRHLKRLLAFSTISHLGIMLAGVSVLDARGTGGVLIYLVGHGAVKGALFMIAGILLALRSSADEIVLYRRGRALWPAGGAMIVAALLLGGWPGGLMHEGSDLIHDAADATTAGIAIIASSALTGAAVLRAALRIFFGWSGAPGPEHDAPTEREREKDDRPFWLMLAPAVLLLAVALIPGHLASRFVGEAAPRLLNPAGHGTVHLASESPSLAAYATLGLTLLLTLLALVRRRPVSRPARVAMRIEGAPFNLLQAFHSGFVADYVAWMLLGLAALALAAGGV